MRDFLGGKRRLLLFSGHVMRWEDGVSVFLEQKKKKISTVGSGLFEECQSLTHKLPKSFYIVTIDVLNITNLVFLPVLQYLHCYESCVKYPLQRFCQRKDYLYCMYDIS